MCLHCAELFWPPYKYVEESLTEYSPLSVLYIRIYSNQTWHLNNAEDTENQVVAMNCEKCNYILCFSKWTRITCQTHCLHLFHWTHSPPVSMQSVCEGSKTLSATVSFVVLPLGGSKASIFQILHMAWRYNMRLSTTNTFYFTMKTFVNHCEMGQSGLWWGSLGMKEVKIKYALNINMALGCCHVFTSLLLVAPYLGGILCLFFALMRRKRHPTPPTPFVPLVGKQSDRQTDGQTDWLTITL